MLSWPKSAFHLDVDVSAAMDVDVNLDVDMLMPPWAFVSA